MVTSTYMDFSFNFKNALRFQMKQTIFNKKISVFLGDKHIYNYDIRLSIQLPTGQGSIGDDLCIASNINLQKHFKKITNKNNTTICTSTLKPGVY